VSDPTETDKSVVPSDTTDQCSNDKLECNVSRVATSKPKKNRKSKCRPDKIHASKHAIKRSKRGTLVDRGANGGALGNDAKVIFKRNETADVTGIDNHDNGTISPVIQTTNGSRVTSSRPRTDVRPNGKDTRSNAEHKVERKR